MARIVMYTTQVCPYCVQAKRLLNRKGVAFDEVDVSRDPELRRTMVQKAGGRLTVPQIFVDDKYLSDCDGMYALERAGKLDALLKSVMSERKINVACVQLRCGDDVAENVRSALALIREAHKAGAQFIATPENTNLMAADGGAKLEKTFAEKDDKALPQFSAAAEELGIWLLVGSLGIKVSEDKTANRSYLIGPNGRISARYDKVHLFDVNLPSGETYRESNTVAPGEQAVVASLPWGRLGLSVCYDLRFPQLYRTLAKSGAEILTVPSAFTETTGKAHWHVLLRARAIENGCFVVAPAQGGTHANGRKTYGHSLIVGPWGDILAEAGTEPGFVAAELDMEEIAAARGRLPSLHHDRPFGPPG